MRDDAFDASLSPDGSQIVFRDSITRDMWLMDSSGGQARLYLKHEADFHIFQPTWFPDGKRILYGKSRVENGQTTTILESRDLSGNNPATLLSNPRLDDFCWGPTGRLVYSVFEAPPNQYDSNLWELRLEQATGKPNGTPRRLTDWTGFSFEDPLFTADGKRFVFLSQKAQSAVYIGELASGGNELKDPQRLTLDERLDWPGGWSADSKTVYLYSNRNGSFDIYKQGITERSAQPIATGTEEKWAPQVSPDGKWIVYLQWPKVVEGTPVTSGKLMRVPVAGGPSEAVMDVKGRAGDPFSSFPLDTVGGYPSFRCARHSVNATCVVAEAEDKQITFSSFDPSTGKKAQLVRVPGESNTTLWDLSPDGSRIALAVFDYKAGDVQIVPLAGGTPQKISALPWTELDDIAWAADGKSLFVGSYSSRGNGILHMDLSGKAKLLFKPNWDIFTISPSPDGHSLAFGPVITNANSWTTASFPQK